MNFFQKLDMCVFHTQKLAELVEELTAALNESTEVLNNSNTLVRKLVEENIELKTRLVNLSIPNDN